MLRKLYESIQAGVYYSKTRFYFKTIIAAQKHKKTFEFELQIYRCDQVYWSKSDIQNGKLICATNSL